MANLFERVATFRSTEDDGKTCMVMPGGEKNLRAKWEERIKG